MEYVYRPMTEDDLDDCINLWAVTPNISLAKADERENLESYIRKNPGASFVCRFGNELVGTILSGNDGRRAYIYHTAVHPGHQRKGIGEALFHLALRKQSELGMTRIQLNIVEGNDDALAFWQRQGFVMRESVGHMIRFLDEYGM